VVRNKAVEHAAPSWTEAVTRRWPGHSFVADPIEIWMELGGAFHDRTSRTARQFLFLEHGAGVVRMVGGDLEIPAGSLLIMPPSIPWSIRIARGARGIWLAGTETFILANLTMFLLSAESWEGTYTPTLVGILPGPQGAQRRAEIMVDLMAARARLSTAEAPVANYMMMIFNAEMAPRDPDGRTHMAMEPIRDPDARLMLALRALTEQHLGDRLSPEDYAHRLGVGVERLDRACRAMNGATTLTFLSMRAVQRAKVDLRYSLDPVAVVGARVGYPDPAHFSRFFKRHTGHAPSDYRRFCAETGEAAKSQGVELRLTPRGAVWREEAEAGLDPSPAKGAP
jgi:AraC-like DNA-binding protein